MDEHIETRLRAEIDRQRARAEAFEALLRRVDEAQRRWLYDYDVIAYEEAAGAVAHEFRMLVRAQ